MRDSTQDVLVMSGMVKRFATASARKALRIVEPSVLGSGVILGFVAGDLEVGMLKLLERTLDDEMSEE